MANLIIILISIILVVFIAIVGLLYVGPALFGNSAQAMATTLISQAQQVHAGLMMYGLDHGGKSFSDFNESTLITNGSIAKYFGLGKFATVPILQVGGPTNAVNNPLAVVSGGVGFNFGATPPYCGPVGNDYVFILRTECHTTDGVDVVGYTIQHLANSTCSTYSGVDLTAVSSLTSTTIAQICVDINKATGAVPAGATLGANGIPILSGSETGCFNIAGNTPYNYCFTRNSGLGSGPSFYNELYYVYAP